MGKHTIATIGSHSALDISEGAKHENFPTLVICQKEREKPYTHYYKTRKRGKEILGVVDDVLVVDKFADMVQNKYQEYMAKKNSVFVPNRSFAVYVGYDAIENNFRVPIFGNKYLLRAEERDAQKNQY